MRSLLRLLAVASLVPAASCGDDGTAIIPGQPASVSVTVSDSSVERGTQATATALVRDAYGDLIDSVDVVWSSSDPSVATIDASGTISAVAIGITTITATVGDKSGGMPLHVVVPAVVAVNVALNPDSLFENGSVQATAVAIDNQGAAVAEAAIMWSSSNTAVATVDLNGRVSLAGSGTALIRAVADGVNGAFTLAVPNVAQVTIAGGNVARRGEVHAIDILALTAQRVPLALPATWSLATGSAATITPSGIIPTQTGVLRLQAVVGGIEVPFDIEVYDVDDWSVTSEGGNVTAVLAMDNEPLVWLGIGTITLSCVDGALGVRVTAPWLGPFEWNGVPRPVSVYYYTNVTSRTDETWTGTLRLLTHPGPGNAPVRSFVNKLIDAEYLAFWYEPHFSHRDEQLRFRLGGADEVISQVLGACP